MEAPQKPYANITKSFVHLAAQICFMKNCWNPSSMSAATGACTRHYHPDLSIWLSVDPMSDKYPELSPYTYCGNNPVKLVDPDGEEIWIVGEDGNNYKYRNGAIYTADNKPYSPEASSFIENAKNAIDVLMTTKTGNRLISNFEGPDNKDVFIKESIDSKCDNLTTDATTGAFISQTILWNSAGTELPTTAGVQKNAITDLGHEFSHVYDNAKGIKELYNMIYDGLTKSEWRATYKENLIRGELGLPYRTHYKSIHKTNVGETIHETYLLNRKKEPYYPNDLQWKIKY